MGPANHAGARADYVVMDEIQHHGIKGMHWGIRRENPSGGSGSSAKADKKVAKAQQKWEKKAASPRTLFEIHNAAAHVMNSSEIDRINNKPEYKNKDFSKDSPLRRKYYQEYEDTFMKVMNKMADLDVGVSPDGTKRLRYKASNGDIVYGWEPVKHGSIEDGIFLLNTDEQGYVTSIEVSSTAMAQMMSDDPFVADILEHHGIKGMHWGVRRTRAQIDSASEDFKTTSAHRSKVKEAGGTHALSNQELQTVITRLNLEQQYNRLTYEPSKLQKGQKAIKEILGVGKTVQEVHSFVNGPLGKSLKNELKKNQRNGFANNRGLGS
jgi:hypothetical protein